MPVDADVYRVLIASPLDVTDEREVAQDVVIEWNGSRPHEDVYLEPVMYETHVAPDLGKHPQEIIHEQVVESCDFVIGMFWKRIGTETETHPGGAIEEIEHFYEKDGRAIVGFSEKPIPPGDMNTDQYEKLQEFREECERNGLVFTYESIEEFRHLLSQHIAQTMTHLLSENDEKIDFNKKEGREDSDYDASTDYERLKQQADLHVDFDRKTVNEALDRLSTEDDDSPYRVLDVGCGYGNLTKRLFGNDSRFDVTAFDYDEDVIRTAKDEFNAENISYEILDVNDIHEIDLGTFDIVFAAFVLHHLKNQESVMSKLWDLITDGGAFIVRGVDDGPHLHYPPDNNLEFLIEKDSQVKGSDDRFQGRRMYTQMKRLDPQPERVEFDFKIHTTANLNSKEREQYFEVLHSHRIIDIRRLARSVDATEGDKRLYQEMKSRLEKVRERFIGNGHMLDVKPVPVAVAYKQPVDG